MLAFPFPFALRGVARPRGCHWAEWEPPAALLLATTIWLVDPVGLLGYQIWAGKQLVRFLASSALARWDCFSPFGFLSTH